MNNKAYVKDIIGDKAVLSIKRECMCGGKENCDSKCFALQSDIIEITTDNLIKAKTGDYVEVEGKTSAVLVYSAIVFIMPIFSAFFLYFIVQAITENIILPYIISGVFFIFSLIFGSFLLNNKIKAKNNFKITKIL